MLTHHFLRQQVLLASDINLWRAWSSEYEMQVQSLLAMVCMWSAVLSIGEKDER